MATAEIRRVARTRPGEGDAIRAAADLCDRAGANGFDIGNATGAPGDWRAVAYYRGAALVVNHEPTAGAAATALACRLLTGAVCRCGRKVALRDTAPASWCRWRLVGPRWVAGCDAPPMEIPADQRGDVRVLQRAVTERIDPDRKKAAS